MVTRSQADRGLLARIFVGPTTGRTVRRSIFFFLLLIAVIGPWIVTHDPIRPDPFNTLAPPSAEHWFGTDHLGLDIYSRVVTGTRIDFTLALIGVLLGGGLGSVMGAWAAYRRGWVDTVLLRVVEVLQSFPVLLLGLAMFAALGSLEIFGPLDTGIVVLVIAIASVNFPAYLRQIRSVLIPLTDAEFVPGGQVQRSRRLGDRLEPLHSQRPRPDPGALRTHVCIRHPDNRRA